MKVKEIWQWDIREPKQNAVNQNSPIVYSSPVGVPCSVPSKVPPQKEITILPVENWLSTWYLVEVSNG